VSLAQPNNPSYPKKKKKQEEEEEDVRLNS
jgi:hypothetical protein